jgi:outer membrane immunogenic protein
MWMFDIVGGESERPPWTNRLKGNFVREQFQAVRGGLLMRHWCSVSALAVGAFFAVSGAASAADIPLKALPPPPLFIWTGVYGGANVGYSWGSSVATTDVAIYATTYSEGVPHHGWEASVEGGYCYQPGRDRDTNFVACLEVRYDFPAERGSTTLVSVPAATVTNTTHIDPLLIGPHLGFTTNANRTLWYGAGGVAIGQVGGNSIGTDAFGTSAANPASKWATGWFVGAGVEQMLGNNWGVKVEYDYVRLDTGGVTAPYAGSSLTFNYDAALTSSATLASHPFDNVVTAGINYHFH